MQLEVRGGGEGSALKSSPLPVRPRLGASCSQLALLASRPTGPSGALFPQNARQTRLGTRRLDTGPSFPLCSLLPGVLALLLPSHTALVASWWGGTSQQTGEEVQLGTLCAHPHIPVLDSASTPYSVLGTRS